MPAPAAAAAVVSAAGKLSKLAAVSSKGAAVGGRVAIRGAKKYRRASKLYRLTARIVGDVPVPVFGSARVASEWMGHKAHSSLPRYAPWVVPVTAGGLWFAWPAIAAVSASEESDEEGEELSSWMGLWTRLEEEEESANGVVVVEGGSTTNWNGVVLAGAGAAGGDGRRRPAAAPSVASIAVAAVDAIQRPTAIVATSPSAGRRDPNDFSHLHAEWERFHLASINYSDSDDDEDDDEEEDDEDDEEDCEGGGDEDGSEEGGPDETDERQGLGVGVDGDGDVDDGDPSKDEEGAEEEEDEETHCSICLINRQGPCRDSWRLFERCIKENPPTGEGGGGGGDDGRGGEETPDSTDAGASAGDADSPPPSSSVSAIAGKCDRFFQPWFECFGRHRTTYALITNRQVRPEMDMLEDTQETEPFPESLIPALNLEEEEEEAGSTAIEEDGGELDVNVGGRKDEQPQSALLAPDESNVKTRYVRFHLKNESTGNDIRVAYVRDQEGNLLGFDYFTTERREGKTEGDMMFHVLPETKLVTMYGFYRNQEEEEDDGDDGKASGEAKESDTVEVDNSTKPKTVVDEKVYFKEMELTHTKK